MGCLSYGEEPSNERRYCSFLSLTSEKSRHYFSGGTRGGKGKGGYYPEDPWYPTEYPHGGHPTYVPGTYYPKTEPPHYYPSGKGKGGPSKKSKASKGKGKGKGKGGVHYDDDFYPTVDDIPFFDDKFFDDAFFDDDDCELVTFNETFSFAGPSLFLAPDTDITTPGTPSLPGTVFIFEEAPIFELQTDDVVIEGTTINGICTRTTVGEEGGGMCQFTFVDDEGYTINVSGYLEGPFGSQLAITGGTGSTTGVVGSMDFFPTFGDLTDPEAVGDIFLDTTRFDVIADIGIIVCPSSTTAP